MVEIAQQQILALEKKVGREAKSPLFAQLANFYLEQNRAEDALRICDAGLANFPFYTTGHLVKGKALAALHMKAEARREFEFVLDFLPRNELVNSLLEQIPPGEDETLTGSPQEIKPLVIEPKHETRPAIENRILPAPHLFPEQETGFTGFEQPAQEQAIELPPLPAPASEPSFFDAITQMPIASPTEEILEFPTPSIEAPEITETPSFGGFDVQVPEQPAVTESPETAFADIPRTVPEPSGEFEFPVAAAEQEAVVQAPSEEESFEIYASRRRAELKGEDTLTLDDYLSNAEVAPPEEVSLELPITTEVQEKIEDLPVKEEPPIEMLPKEEPTIEVPPKEEPLIDISSLLPQVPEEIQPEKKVSLRLDENLPEPTIVLPQIQPAELPISDSIQNNIEEIANKLKSAGKITPVIDIAQKETPPASEQDLPVSMGFVTPTLAEIYAKQGWFDDAIKAYRALARNKPAEKERFEKRIDELEKLKNQGKK